MVVKKKKIETNKLQNKLPYTHCLNCGAELQGMYCHVCGQEAVSKNPTVGSFIFEYFNHAFIWDSNFFRTTWTLICRPGQLTNDFLAGKFASQEHPLKLNMFLLFVFITLFALFASPDKMTSSVYDLTYSESVRSGLQAKYLLENEYAEKIKESSRDTVRLLAPLFIAESHSEIISSIETIEDVEGDGLDKWIAVIPRVLIDDNILVLDESGYYRFDPESDAGEYELELVNSVWGKMVGILSRYFPMLILFTAPLLAFSLRLVQRKSQRPRIHHFIFALHYTAFLELLMLCIYLIYLAFAPPMLWLQWVLVVGSCVHLTVAFRRVYQINKWTNATFKALLTSLIYCLICLMAFVLIFLVASIIVSISLATQANL